MKIGIIGAGYIGGIHAKNLSELGAQLFIVDIDGSRAMGLAKELGVNHETRYESLNMDAAIICTPTYSHAEIAIHLLRKEVDLFIEKPLALSMRDLLRISRESGRRGLIVMAGHNLRFSNVYRAAKELLKHQSKREMLRVEAWRVIKGGGWFLDTSKSGGALLDLGIHDIDFLVWSLGDAVEVKSSGSPNDAKVTIIHDNGSTSHLKANWFAEEFSAGLNATSKCGFKLDLIPWGLRQNDRDLKVPQNDPYKSEIQHFLQCLETRTEPMTSIENVIKSYETTFSCLENIGWHHNEV